MDSKAKVWDSSVNPPQLIEVTFKGKNPYEGTEAKFRSMCGFGRQSGKTEATTAAISERFRELPKVIIRLSDGEEFVLNENGKYHLKKMQSFKDSGYLVNEYSYETLMKDFKEFFKVKE